MPKTNCSQSNVQEPGVPQGQSWRPGSHDPHEQDWGAGWWEQGWRESPPKAMFWPGHPTGTASAWTFWGAFMGCLRLLLSREERGSSGCCSHPHWLLHRAPTFCVSTCGACDDLTVSLAWSSGQEARNPAPRNDPRTSPKSLPTCCRVFSTLPSPHVLQSLLHTSVQTSLGRLSWVPQTLTLTPSQPVFPRDFSRPFHSSLKMSAVMAIICLIPVLWVSFLLSFFVSSWGIQILHRLLLGRVPGTRYRTIQCPSPCAPKPLELDPIQLNEQMMQFHSDTCLKWDPCVWATETESG